MAAFEQELGRVLVELALAAWIGGSLLVRLARVRLDAAALVAVRTLLDQVKYVASAVVLAGIVLEIDADPRQMSTRLLTRMAVILLLAATHLYAALLVAPRLHLAAGAASPEWIERRTSRLELGGLALAVAAVLLG